jgi:hypothetical protein
MRLFNINYAILKETQIKVFVDPDDADRFNGSNAFYIDNNKFLNFLHETLSIDGSVQDYFNENAFDIVIDGIYCYIIYNNDIETKA